MKSRVQIVAVTRKPDSASFEQRILAYQPHLREQGIDVTWRELPKGLRAQRQFLRDLRGAHLVWWHRHLLHPLAVGPLVRTLAPVVFEFDDPVACSPSGRTSLTRLWRFRRMLRSCDAAITASPGLARLAQPYCPRVEVVPMAVDLPDLPPRRGRRDTCRLLWIGGRATQPYLKEIRDVLAELPERVGDVELRLVAHRPETFGSMKVDYRPWSPAEQALALRECDIGLCPMPDTRWTRGKCPYKVLQYMVAGMPWAGSAVGENLTMAGEIERGICAASAEEWLAALLVLVTRKTLRRKLGEAGRRYVMAHHDRQRLAGRLGSLLREMADVSPLV